MFNNKILMPPTQRILASRFQGYVCRLCLSKTQVTLRQQPRWLSRSARNPRRDRPQSKEASQQVDLDIPEIRYFEQYPDGRRVEIKFDPLDGIEEELRDYENEKDKSMGVPVDVESFRNADYQPKVFLPDMNESVTGLAESTEEELEALIKRLDGIDFSTMSTEDRSKLREELLKSATTGTWFSVKLYLRY